MFCVFVIVAGDESCTQQKSRREVTSSIRHNFLSYRSAMVLVVVQRPRDVVMLAFLLSMWKYRRDTLMVAVRRGSISRQ